MSSFRVSVVAATFLLCVSLIGVVQLLQDSNELIGAGLVPSSSSSISVDASHRRLQFSQAEQELAKVRPIIFTYYEQPAHSDLLNDDTLDLIENWRKAWFDMGKWETFELHVVIVGTVINVVIASEVDAHTSSSNSINRSNHLTPNAL
jgi:hypothetical protein